MVGESLSCFIILKSMKNIILTLVALSLTCHASSSVEITPLHKNRERSKALLNQNLKIAGESWKPFWIIYCPDGTEKGHQRDWPTKGNMSYGGVLWKLLHIMQQTRNITFTLSRPPDSAWGICHSKNNCTGMIGMVNRGEVDIALGDNYI